MVMRSMHWWWVGLLGAASTQLGASACVGRVGRDAIAAGTGEGGLLLSVGYLCFLGMAWLDVGSSSQYHHG